MVEEQAVSAIVLLIVLLIFLMALLFHPYHEILGKV